MKLLKAVIYRETMYWFWFYDTGQGLLCPVVIGLQPFKRELGELQI